MTQMSTTLLSDDSAASTAEVNDKYLGEIANVSENVHSVSQLLGEMFDFFKI
jgi:hypothetical protein